jgi:adenylate cyclase class 2
MNEVELKLELSYGEHARLLEEFRDWPGYTRLETDIYFNSVHRDLIKSEECVRLRFSGDWAELTWKPPTTEEMRIERQFWKQELNLPITGSVEPWREMLRRLDFTEYVVVEKRRTYRKIDETTSIMIDEVTDVGVFVEIETMAEHPEAALQKNRDIVKALDLERSPVVNTPYRDMAFSRKKPVAR